MVEIYAINQLSLIAFIYHSDSAGGEAPGDSEYRPDRAGPAGAKGKTPRSDRLAVARGS
jgi:hypothetical protein